MQVGICVTFYTATVSYDMYDEDKLPTRVCAFEKPADAVKFIDDMRKKFVKERGICPIYHNYGDAKPDSDGRTFESVNKRVYWDMFDGVADELIAESEGADRMYARIDFHTL